jgi:hypothetical protein
LTWRSTKEDGYSRAQEARESVLVGLSLVILMFGAGTQMARLIPSEGRRRLLLTFIAK